MPLINGSCNNVVLITYCLGLWSGNSLSMCWIKLQTWEVILWCSFLNLTAIADWPSPFGIQKSPFKFTYLSIRADGSRGDRPPLNGYAAGRTKNGDGNESSQSSDGKVSSSSNNEAIISLFGRIKSSISKREAIRTKKRNPSSSDKPKVQSVPDVLLQPRKEVKGTAVLCYIFSYGKD